MLILRDPELASRLSDYELRRLVEQRFVQISAGEGYDWGLQGYMIVAARSGPS